jgi:hypothetical protein
VLEALLQNDHLKLPNTIKAAIQDEGMWRALKFIAVAIEPFDQVRHRCINSVCVAAVHVKPLAERC